MTSRSTNAELSESIFIQPFTFNGILWSQHTNTEILQKCSQFKFRSDDVVIATFPRSGTTVTQEIVWQIINHDIIKKGEKYGSLMQRVPFLEMDFAFKGINGKPNSIDSLQTWTKQRLIKTHLPYSFIKDEFENTNPKMIIVMRNPKDNVVSCYNFYCGHEIIKSNIPFAEYWKSYMTGESVNGDFRDFHLQWWSLRERENILIVRYEDIVQQPFQQIRSIALFLGYDLSAEKIDAIVFNTTFDAMSKNEHVNVPLKNGSDKFLRKGQISDWKTWLTVVQNEIMDTWIRDHFTPVGLNFTFE